MMKPIQFGQIVWAEIADANGVRKARPAVVVTPSERITTTAPLEVVAITSLLPQRLPADHVLLPWHARGHPRTGLYRKCAAVCSWIARIAPADIQSIAGIVPSAVLLDIMARISSVMPPDPHVKDPSEAGNGEPPSPLSEQK